MMGLGGWPNPVPSVTGSPPRPALTRCPIFRRRETLAKLEPTGRESRGLVWHPGLNVQNVRGRVPAFRADWVVGNAQVNHFGLIERADRGKPAAPQRPRESALGIAEDG